MNRLSTTSRAVMRIFFLLSAFAATSAQCQDNSYPTKRINIIVPYAAGGTADALARIVGRALSQDLAQVVTIETKPGAGTAIGTKFVASAKPDGYTLLWGGVSTQVMNPLINAVGFDPLRDFTAIAPVGSLALVVISQVGLPVKNMADLIALAKSRSTPISYATAGAGTSNHLAAELLNSTAGIKLLHVPYKGSAPALADLLGGHVDMMWDLQATSMSHIKTGRVRALAVTGARRSALLPDTPTMAELGLGNNTVSVWHGVFGPAGMPKPIVDKLNAAITRVVSTREIHEQFAALGVEPEYGTSAEYDAYVRLESDKWKRVIEAANLKAR
jgi:tripartite-type tricarboxylate transporter receptor subunit TctC